MPAGIEDMPDRLSVLARGMRAVLCIKAKSDPLRSATGQKQTNGSAAKYGPIGRGFELAKMRGSDFHPG